MFIYLFSAALIVFGIAGAATCTAFPGPDDDSSAINSNDVFLLVAVFGTAIFLAALLNTWAQGGFQ